MTPGHAVRTLRRTRALLGHASAAAALLQKNKLAKALQEARQKMARQNSLPFLPSLYLRDAMGAGYPGIFGDVCEPVNSHGIYRFDPPTCMSSPCPHRIGEEVLLDPCTIGFSHNSISNLKTLITVGGGIKSTHPKLR